MIALLRALFALSLVAAVLAPAPLAAADGCVRVDTDAVGSGLRIVANAGQSIQLGFRSSVPGDGLGFVLILSPSLCPAIAAGDLAMSGSDPTDYPRQVQEQAPTFIPLP